MYCVIQEIERKKPNKYGASKEITTGSLSFAIGGEPKTKYTWSYSNERHERPIRTAYKLSIHQSTRLSGKATKFQNVITTTDFYSIAEGWFNLYDHDKKITEIATKLKCRCKRSL